MLYSHSKSFVVLLLLAAKQTVTIPHRMSFTPIWVCFLRFYWKRSLRHDIFWTTWMHNMHKSFGTTSCIHIYIYVCGCTLHVKIMLVIHIWVQIIEQRSKSHLSKWKMSYKARSIWPALLYNSVQESFDARHVSCQLTFQVLHRVRCRYHITMSMVRVTISFVQSIMPPIYWVIDGS